MQLESNFEFTTPDVIRIKGTRIGIDIVLEDYLDGYSPEEIAGRYSNLTLKQVYTTITYYLHNKERLDAYLEEGRRQSEEAWQEQRRNPHPGVKRILEIKAAREKKRMKTEMVGR
ncbi:MAG: DUF433 domain-containing protein [Deltaproteobacteria bacterium]|nr:DUF433 domain-containing protein [Deltaproteobacteria bacterium]